jgi:MoaA/NifB/PqqE/SkfB family radical SAM enzyme
MRADVFELLRHAKEKGIYTAVAASVTPLLTREKLEQMRDLGSGNNLGQHGWRVGRNP